MGDGGSVAFWNEILKPEKIVGVDVNAREDSEYFQKYVHTRGLESKVRTYWRTDQADERALLRIVEQEFGGAVDMVTDDASHFYDQTLASFQILFPLLPPGGLYIIEDWAWEHWPEFHSPFHDWHRYRSLTPLIFELIEATGTSQHLITSVEVFQGFVIVERGPAPTTNVTPLVLADQILRRPTLYRTLGMLRKTVRH
jgi:cephalosporin hydroxylase